MRAGSSISSSQTIVIGASPPVAACASIAKKTSCNLPLALQLPLTALPPFLCPAASIVAPIALILIIFFSVCLWAHFKTRRARRAAERVSQQAQQLSSSSAPPGGTTGSSTARPSSTSQSSPDPSTTQPQGPKYPNILPTGGPAAQPTAHVFAVDADDPNIDGVNPYAAGSSAANMPYGSTPAFTPSTAPPQYNTGGF